MKGKVAAALVTGAAVLGAVAVTAGADPDPNTEWNTGQLTNSSRFVPDFFGGAGRIEFNTGQFAAFEAVPGQKKPKVGEPFYVRGNVANVGSASEAPTMAFWFDEQFTDWELAIGSQNPVICYTGDLDNPDGRTRDSSPGCGQSPLPIAGGVGFYSSPLDPGEFYEVQVPITVKSTKSGQGSGNSARFGIQVNPALSDSTRAEHYLTVFAGDGAGGSGSSVGPGSRPGAPIKAGRCRGKKPTQVGTTGNDVLRGTKKRDVFVTGPGNDRVFGLAGNDYACLGSGNDRFIGGAGNDYANGGAGIDRLMGNRGIDRLLGGPGGDFLFGGPGPDRLFGQAGRDVANGQAGKDVCRSTERRRSC